ncbi:MAG: nucleoside 2-deoxyribosyltransferase [Solirubrobacteraceae bacterium]
MSKIYIASPLGFDEPGRLFMTNVLLPALAQTKWMILDPWADQQAHDVTPVSEFAADEEAVNRAIGERNLSMLRAADGMLAWLDGVDLDSGTAAELGFAAARGIPIVAVRTDLRLAGDNASAPVNLQVLAFLRETGGELHATVADAIASLETHLGRLSALDSGQRAESDARAADSSLAAVVQIRGGEAQFEAQGALSQESDPSEPPGCARRARRLSGWSRRAVWVRNLALPGALLFGLVAAVEAALLVAQANNFPKRSTWSPHSIGWWSFNTVAVVTLMLTSLLAWRLSRSLSDRREELILQQHCRSLWRYLTEVPKLPAEHLGVHVWSLRDPRVWFVPHWLTSLMMGDSRAEPTGWRSFLPRTPFLARRAAFTNERRVHPSMAFTRDKGVIGRCWRLEREIVENLQPLREVVTAQDFYEKFSYDERYGLSWRQWWNTRHFCAIWVYPIYDGPVSARRFAGCVSVDLTCSGRFDLLERLATERNAELDSLLWDFVAVLRGDWRTT